MQTLLISSITVLCSCNRCQEPTTAAQTFVNQTLQDFSVCTPASMLCVFTIHCNFQTTHACAEPIAAMYCEVSGSNTGKEAPDLQCLWSLYVSHTLTPASVTQERLPQNPGQSQIEQAQVSPCLTQKDHHFVLLETTPPFSISSSQSFYSDIDAAPPLSSSCPCALASSASAIALAYGLHQCSDSGATSYDHPIAAYKWHVINSQLTKHMCQSRVH